MDTKSLDSHKDIANSERQLKEKSVSSTVRAFSAFTNPFEMSTDAIDRETNTDRDRDRDREKERERQRERERERERERDR